MAREAFIFLKAGPTKMVVGTRHIVHIQGDDDIVYITLSTGKVLEIGGTSFDEVCEAFLRVKEDEDEEY